MKFVALILVVAATYVNGHVFLLEPIARTSLHLRPDLGAQQPFWWDNFG